MPWSQKTKRVKNCSGLKVIKEVRQLNAVSDSQVNLGRERKFFSPDITGTTSKSD